MRILVFGYDFPHNKTVQGLYRLASWRSHDLVVWLAPRISLNHYTTSIPNFPQRSLPEPPSYVCSTLGIKFVIGSHSLETWRQLLSGESFDLAIILGARVISRELIEAVNAPIINFHPGVLPDNRGLYNLHWAILNKLPQGVTTHVISPEVDRGEFLLGGIVPVYPHDTLMDIGLRLANMEMAHLMRLIELAANNGKLATEGEVGEGRYNPHIEATLESEAQQLLADYTSRYTDYVDRFLASSRFPYAWSVTQ